jgi:hypothetical protein
MLLFLASRRGAPGLLWVHAEDTETARDVAQVAMRAMTWWSRRLVLRPGCGGVRGMRSGGRFLATRKEQKKIIQSMQRCSGGETAVEGELGERRGRVLVL